MDQVELSNWYPLVEEGRFYFSGRLTPADAAAFPTLSPSKTGLDDATVELLERLDSYTFVSHNGLTVVLKGEQDVVAGRQAGES